MSDKKVATCFNALKSENIKRFDRDEIDRKYETSYRNEFQRDKDRILYSRAFRRLRGKTQVFLAGFDDHVRDRLTHTLEVAQLAKTISSTLGLDEGLTEAIALGHDIGHTPFGHVGERTLNDIMSGRIEIKNFKLCNPNDKGFKHNWQSLRVLEELEKDDGLNLTNYTLWGILNHSSLKMRGYDKRPQFYSEKYNKLIDNSHDNWTVEALIVRVADEIAQRHHDIEDGLFAKIITKEEVLSFFKNTFNDDAASIKIEEKHNIISKIKSENSCFKDENLFIPTLVDFKENREYLVDLNLLLLKIQNETDKVIYTPMISNLIIKYYMLNYINHIGISLNNIKADLGNENKLKLRYINYDKYVKALVEKDKSNNKYYFFDFDKDFSEKDDRFQKFLMNKVLNSHMVQVMDGQGRYIIRKLFEAYVTNPLQLPDNGILSIYKNILKYKVKDDLINELKKIKREYVGNFRNTLLKFHNKVSKIDNCDAENISCKDEEKNKGKDVYFINEELTNYEYNNILFRTIADYIGGMTDEFTIKEFQKLYGIKMF